jgi:hypothetical protein
MTRTGLKSVLPVATAAVLAALAIATLVFAAACEDDKGRDATISTYSPGEASAVVSTYLSTNTDCGYVMASRPLFEEVEDQPGVWIVAVTLDSLEGKYQVFEGTNAVSVIAPFYHGVC